MNANIRFARHQCISHACDAPFFAGKTLDFETYMSAPLGTADIFFPSDFEMLRRLVLATQRNRSGRRQSDELRVVTHKDFIQRYGQVACGRTMSGYNPILEDYGNTRMLLT